MEKDKFPKRKNIHLKNFDYKGNSHVYFVTICTFKKNNYFNEEKHAKLITEELIYRKDILKQVDLICYCIMPDHLHLLMSFSENYKSDLLNWVKTFKRFTSKIIKEKYKLNDLWQRGFYEHILRNNESIINKAIYIMENPIRKEIVKKVNEYPYSQIFYDPL
ncbi:MAG: transposase [Candidatus Cloacimonetes bacterium]|jgi:putative transposase|nr:transposase [Candidatus Cloacimonadota bacterium]